LRCYFTFKKPPFYRHFDPFDGLLFFLLVGLMAFQLLSGLHLFAHAHPPDYWWAQVIHMSTDWLVWLLGGTQQVRLYHHMVEWIMIAGVIFHVYLQVAKTVIWQDGHIGQMFGGYKYKDVD
jgi:Ni/Fe-hydrogenase 1 B-type cytochrome subunit